MNSLYVNAQQADLDLLTVVKYCQPLPLNVVENDKELFPQEVLVSLHSLLSKLLFLFLGRIEQRPIMVTAQGTQLRGVKTIATYVAGLSHPQLLGKTDVEKALVEQWLTFSTTLVRPALESKVLKNMYVQPNLSDGLSFFSFFLSLVAASLSVLSTMPCKRAPSSLPTT